MSQRESLQSDFAQCGNVLFLKIDSKWKSYLMTSFSLWVAQFLRAFRLSHLVPFPPPQIFCPFTFSQTEKVIVIFFLWAMQFCPWLPLTIRPTPLPLAGSVPDTVAKNFFPQTFSLPVLSTGKEHFVPRSCTFGFFLTFMSQLNIISVGNYPEWNFSPSITLFYFLQRACYCQW